MTQPLPVAGRFRSTRARPTDDQLLDAALEVFAALGFRATTMSAVAERSNSTKPTLYAHFGDKDALYRRLLDREADTCRATLFAAYAAGAGLGLRGQVHADTRALFDYAAAHPAGFRLLFGSDITPALVEVRDTLLADVHGQIARRVHDYLVRAGLTTPRRRVSREERQLAAMLAAVPVSAAQYALATGADLDHACGLAAEFSAAALTGLEWAARPVEADPAAALRR